MSESITQQVAALVQGAVEDLGNRVDWDVSMVVVPGPQGQPQPLLAITIVVASVTLGDHHSGCMLIPPSILTQDQAREIVLNMSTQLEQVKREAAEAVLANSNGHGQVGSGLIVPGQ